MTKITNGDRVTYIHDAKDWGIALAVPDMADTFVAYMNPHGGGIPYTLHFNGNGQQHRSAVVVERFDAAWSAWLMLDNETRSFLVSIRDVRKIAAIRYLMHLTGLGLIDAGRAIEEFSA